MMKKAFLMVFMVPGVALLASCGMVGGLFGDMFGKAPLMSVVVLYNNTGDTILVEDKRVRSYREVTIEYPAETNEGVIIFRAGCAHNYAAPERRPGTFKSTDWLLRGAYQAQLEPDGRLHLVPPSSTMPVDVSTLQQPPGFPLSPTDSCGQPSAS